MPPRYFFFLFCFISDKQKHVCVCTKNKDDLIQTIAHLLIGGLPASLTRFLKGSGVVYEVVEVVEVNMPTELHWPLRNREISIIQ